MTLGQVWAIGVPFLFMLLCLRFRFSLRRLDREAQSENTPPGLAIKNGRWIMQNWAAKHD